MRRLPLILPLLLLACIPPKPPVYVVTQAPLEATAAVREATFDLRPIQKVDLHDFKRAFVKKYESEEAFLKAFHQDLAKALNEQASPAATTFILELPSLEVDSHTEGYWVTTGGGGPHSVPMQSYRSTEYCDIRLTYRVVGPDGRPLLEGMVKESTDKGEFLHPNQSKLANAVEGVRQHLVAYLRGRLGAEHIAAPPPPKA